MTLNETPVIVEAPQACSLGVVCQPGVGTPMRSVGVILVVGGAQYRAGSHRQCVLLARRLAREGVCSLRFDFPGLGDSPGEPLAFDRSETHIGAAINRLVSHNPTLKQVVLWGLCDGASASLLYCQASTDARVTGLALLNPWITSEAAVASAQIKHYYLRRLGSADFWQKLRAGGIGWRAARELANKLHLWVQPRSPSMPYAQRMALAWQGFEGHVLLMLSERDLTARAFEEHVRHDGAWHDWDRKPRLTQQHLKGADHTCSAIRSQQEMESSVIHWLNTL